MCRNIKKLRQPDRLPTDEELQEAARQFVRKISGYRVPSKVNQVAFETAVSQIAAISKEMFEKFPTATSEKKTALAAAAD